MKPIQYFTHTNYSLNYLKQIQNDFNYSNKENLTWLFNRGMANGYIVMPHDHELTHKCKDSYNAWNEAIDFPIHGGCTFAEYVRGMQSNTEWTAEANFHLLDLHPDDIIIGFDTAHSDDSLDKWSTKDVLDHLEGIVAYINKHHLQDEKLK